MENTENEKNNSHRKIRESAKILLSKFVEIYLKDKDNL